MRRANLGSSRRVRAGAIHTSQVFPMSRDKKPRKAKYTDPKTGQFRHTDGDRRHRSGASAKKAIKDKKRMQELGGPVPPDEPPAPPVS